MAAAPASARYSAAAERLPTSRAGAALPAQSGAAGEADAGAEGLSDTAPLRRLARWAEASALVRERLPAHLDVPYGAPGESDAQRLDVFPARRGGAPVLVLLHGGHWCARSRQQHSFVAPVFVQAGAMVVVPGHALMPAASIEQIALQAAQAVAWVWRHAARYGGNPARLVLVGHGSGAHLAAMLLCCRWPLVAPDLPPQLVSGALALSGLFDLAPLQSVLRLSDAQVQRLSPLRFDAPAQPLVALAGAEEDRASQQQTLAIARAWGTQTVRHHALLPGHHHFSLMHDLVDPRGVVHGHARQLLGLGAAAR